MTFWLSPNEHRARTSAERTAQEHVDAGKGARWHFTQYGAFSSRFQPSLAAHTSCKGSRVLTRSARVFRARNCVETDARLHCTTLPQRAPRHFSPRYTHCLWAEAARSTLIYRVHLCSSRWSKVGCGLRGANTLPIKQTGPAHFRGDSWSLREALRLASSCCSKTTHHLNPSFISYAVVIWLSLVTTHTWYLN